ncbi:MAG TPA: hypothetical protein VFC00_30940 [Micromonosporaceae bacterium]|nr:hypothetical protein [Micromonosporaceae bacterium]
MSSLRADITALVKQQRAEGLKVVTLDALDQILSTGQPDHLLDIHGIDEWRLRHAHCQPACPVYRAVGRSMLIHSPHAKGHTYRVWLDDGRLKFQEVTDD